MAAYGQGREQPDPEMTNHLTRAWPDIVSRYRECVEASAPLKGMLDLVEQIAASPYARSPILMMVRTCACPRSGMAPSSSAIDTHVEAKEWHRTENEADAFRRLERFLDQLPWLRGRRNMISRSRVAVP